MAEVLDNPTVVVARELTKKFEEVKKGSALEVEEYFSSKTPKGEFVVLVNLVSS
ncbi:16S rRNA (cytidine(1402)-2'-O)-methyltransferase [hydrothermal vent metagenome]|uniref:16S rRNA (Cytidine(1402)-2'-O)-methyltransferase n=1 Tax=hydrothermal vent metagenome TaxID=652676 RepID=A0A3B0TUF9_9ZZZZ